MKSLAFRWVAITATEDFPVAIAPVRAALKGIAKLRIIPLPFRPLSEAEEEEYARQLQGSEGILLRPGYITPSFLDRLPRLRVVAVHGAGVDQVDVPACTERGVLVTNAPGANADSVTEFTIGMMLSLARRIPGASQQVQGKKMWGEARHTGTELKGKTLGLVGLGQIGERVARIATAFGMKVCAYDPGLTAGQIKERGARRLKFDALLAESDFVSLHVPLIPATPHLINRETIRKMKKGAFLINCARGSLVDEKALSFALHTGKLSGAALDVLGGEPPNPDSPIFGTPNILVTPHMAGSTKECLESIARVNGQDLARFIQGKRPKHPVNKPKSRK